MLSRVIMEKMTHILLLWTLTIQSYFMSAAQAQSLKLDKATKCHLFLNSDSHDMEPFGDPLILNVSPGTKRRNRYRHDEYKESHRPYIHGQEGEGEEKE